MTLLYSRGFRKSVPGLWFLLVLACGSGEGAADDGTRPGGVGTGGALGTGDPGTGGQTSTGGFGTALGSGGESASGGAEASGGSSGGADAQTGGSDNVDATGGTDPNAPTPSAGCGLDSDQAASPWVTQTPLMIGGAPREWSVWMPAGYDPERAYPVVFLFHGCSGGSNNLPMQNVTGEDAIVVRGTGSFSGTCWDWAPSDGVEVQFFDAMVEQMEATRCVDTSRFFGVGYSSGSYLLSMLGCYRADVLRGAASVAGGSYDPPRTNCSGTLARMFVHDLQDKNNDISGSERERDRLGELSSCDMNAVPVPEEPSPCARYQGCDPGYPVVWCPTTGQGHNRQDSFAVAFWDFFSGL